MTTEPLELDEVTPEDEAAALAACYQLARRRARIVREERGRAAQAEQSAPTLAARDEKGDGRD